VRGNVHTCTIDGFCSLLKRGIVGTFHNISRNYLPLYVAEFEWRHNNRDNPEIFRDAIALCLGAVVEGDSGALSSHHLSLRR
jgi:ISXO2-like transposase domain